MMMFVMVWIWLCDCLTSVSPLQVLTYSHPVRANAVTASYLSREMLQLHATGGNSRKGKKDDIIDAEIVSSNERKGGSKFSLFGLAKNTAKAALNGLVKVVPGLKDKISNTEKQELTQKQKRVAAFNDELDAIFKDSGLLGGLAKTVIKSFNEVIVDNFADASTEIQDIQFRIRKMIEREGSVQSYLGKGIRSYPPLSSSMSSFAVNGQNTKQLFLIYPIAGPMSLNTGVTGQVEVQTSGDNIAKLVLRLSNGITLDLTKTAQRYRDDEDDDEDDWRPPTDNDTTIIDAEIIR